ncbi:MAG: methyltransferase [Thermoprotei archaeon]|nr:MAG: methyltransferase [Thermoprotei archaeon]
MVLLKNMRFIDFKPKQVIVLDCYSARSILERSKGTIKFSILVNLGLRGVDVEICDDKAIMEGYVVSLNQLREIADDEEGVYAISEKGLFKLTIADEHFYRLRRVADNTAPTLEIDGIHMHKIEGITPWDDAKKKVSLAKVRKGNEVLDTCMGLGYTAIHSALRGARVLTVEVDPNVIELASYNPWSWKLEELHVKVVQGDICEVIREIEDESFDRIIHDPPRFSAKTGHLYGRDLYSNFYRVLKDNGILFHYVGSPGRVRGLDLARGVAKRLEDMGFDVRILRKETAVLAFKG